MGVPNGPDVPTPVVDGTHFYSFDDRGVVYCLDAKTGATVYGPVRIKPGTYSASPILGDGKIYITSEEGLTTVVKAGPVFEVLAENAINEYVLSSIAISDWAVIPARRQASVRHRAAQEVDDFGPLVRPSRRG